MKPFTACLALALTASLGLSVPANAQGIGGFFKRIVTGVTDDSSNRDLIATIWVDPDGCEHWVMDDGLEGFMSAHLDSHGKPVCRAVPPSPEICTQLDSNALFASGSARLTSASRNSLKGVFADLMGKTIIVNGYTDSLGDEAYNMDLSLRRAAAVAKVAEEMGVFAEPRGFGEQMPIASNDTAQGRSQNRRVELSCS